MSNRPPATLVAFSLITLLACLLLTSISLASFVSEDPMDVIGGAIILPCALLMATAQYWATFRSHKFAARISGILLLLLGGLILFGFAANLLECIFEGMRIPWLGLFLPMLAVGSAICYAGWLNKSWSRTLQSQNADAIRPAPGQHTRREIAALFTAIVIVTSLTIYFISHTYPPFAEHVTRDQVPFSLPHDAQDISYARGMRGTKAYEFAIDEAGFINWVNSGIGSIESESADVPILTINAPRTIPSYRAFMPNSTDLEKATITSGLYYDWQKEDRGVHAVFDRSAMRAYYYAHFH